MVRRKIYSYGSTKGAAIIEVSGHSSVASAGQAAIDHMRDWILGCDDEYVSMSIMTDGKQYNIEPGIMFSFPVRCRYGRYAVVEDLKLTKDCKNRLKRTEEELVKERDIIADLLPKETANNFSAINKHLITDATVNYINVPEIKTIP